MVFHWSARETKEQMIDTKNYLKSLDLVHIKSGTILDGTPLETLMKEKN